MLPAIINRRSIRRYKSTEVPRPVIEEIVQSGLLAPSSKNRQPWKFIITNGAAKKESLQAMEKGIQREKENPLLPCSARFMGGTEYTLRIMEQAPVVIYVVNPLGIDLDTAIDAETRIYETCNAQSIGAAMENMALTATEHRLGSLWICDVFFAYEELQDWLHEAGVLVAAMAIGYADEEPLKRPRKPMKAVVEWRWRDTDDELQKTGHGHL